MELLNPTLYIERRAFAVNRLFCNRKTMLPEFILDPASYELVDFFRWGYRCGEDYANNTSYFRRRLFAMCRRTNREGGN